MNFLSIFLLSVVSTVLWIMIALWVMYSVMLIRLYIYIAVAINYDQFISANSGLTTFQFWSEVLTATEISFAITIYTNWPSYNENQINDFEEMSELVQFLVDFFLCISCINIQIKWNSVPSLAMKCSLIEPNVFNWT